MPSICIVMPFGIKSFSVFAAPKTSQEAEQIYTWRSGKNAVECTKSIERCGEGD